MYKLVWRSNREFAQEEIESSIETKEEAEYLRREYITAGFEGSIFIRKERKNGKDV